MIESKRMANNLSKFALIPFIDTSREILNPADSVIE